MKRRMLLRGTAVSVGAFAGCVYDFNNESKITFTSTEVPCNTGTIDVDFDDRDLSPEIERKLTEMIAAENYTETPQYSDSTLTVMEIIQTQIPDRRGTIKYDGTCYNVRHEQVFDD